MFGVNGVEVDYYFEQIKNMGVKCIAYIDPNKVNNTYASLNRMQVGNLIETMKNLFNNSDEYFIKMCIEF